MKREIRRLNNSISGIVFKSWSQDREYLSWLKQWEAEHKKNVPVIPYDTQALHLHQKVGLVYIHELFMDFKDRKVEYDYIKNTIKSFQKRMKIQKTLFRNMKSLTDARNIVWKQHLYVGLSQSKTFAPLPKSLMYDNTDLQWIEDSTEYAMNTVKEKHVEDAKISIYSNVGLYLQKINQTLEETLSNIPASWLIAAAWDETADDYEKISL